MTGKADPGESAAACAHREALEETGLNGALVDLRYSHRYRGGKGAFEEHAFLLRAGPGATPATSNEHAGYRWVSPSEAASAVRWRAHARALELAVKAF